MNNLKTVNNIIIALIIILAILFLYNKQENLTPQSEEAINNIASIYSNTDKEVTFNNVNVTGKTSLNGKTALNGDTTLGGNINGKNFGYVNETGNINTTGTITTKLLKADNATLTTCALTSGNIGAAAFNNNGINGPNWYISNATNTLSVDKIILGGHTLDVRNWGNIPDVLHLNGRPIRFV
jgi:hypothetical protein